MGQAIVSPEGQSATFIELFFDLVFVFAITQMVALLYHDLTWVGAGKSMLVFWMVWWAWTQYTWALNAADTQNVLVELVTLTGTAVAFFMAVAVPEAFGNSSVMFAGTYVAVRLIGLTLYSMVALHTPGLQAAVRNFWALSVGGLVCALAGGIVGGEARIWLWSATIVLDLIAAKAAGDPSWDWNIHAEHFAERHGLIVIIALGESLIVAAAGLVSAGGLDGEMLKVGVLAVTVSCALWWTYFSVTMPRMEHGLIERSGYARSIYARDVYSLSHFPMMLGIIAYAVGLEAAIHDPTHALASGGRAAMAIGLALFLVGPAFGLWRASGARSPMRFTLAVGTALAVWFLGDVLPSVTLAVALTGVVALAVFEEVRAARAAHAV